MAGIIYTASESPKPKRNGRGLWFFVLFASLSALPVEALVDLNTRQSDGAPPIIFSIPDSFDSKIGIRDNPIFDQADSHEDLNLDGAYQPLLYTDVKFNGAATEALSVLPKPPEATTASMPELGPIVFDGSFTRLGSAGSLIREGIERVSVLAGRAATLPLHFWPISKMSATLAHGEPFMGLTPSRAAAQAARIAQTNRVGVTIGRLAWNLRDRWSVRGAERSYSSLIEHLAQEKNADPSLNLSISLDLETLGLHIWGQPAEARLVTAASAAWKLARKAAANGIPVEIDMGVFDTAPKIIWIAQWLAQQARLPVRLALSARYPGTQQAITDWAALARKTGLRLGIRLVKGSFIDAALPNRYNERRPLLDRYKSLISLALGHSNELAVAIATHNEEIWEHTRREAQRLDAAYEMHAINGVNMPVQEKMKAAGKLGRVYVSFGPDAPMMGVMEKFSNWWQRLKISLRSPVGPLD